MKTTSSDIDHAPGLPAVPPLAAFRPHKTIDGVDLRGHLLPLHAAFYRRDRGDAVESIGVYSYRGHELFAAWGEVGRAACSFNAVRRARGQWYGTRRGCPVIRPVTDAEDVVGFTILTPDGARPFRFADLR